VTARRAWPADAETLARTATLGTHTWRAFAPAGWTPRPLFVRPARWGSGLADRLHEAFVAEACERGYPQAWLAVPAAHARARRFYERRDWRADTLLEENRGMPMAIYGRSLLP
jgi:GNAT superfamily N-acetyltransferase